MSYLLHELPERLAEIGLEYLLLTVCAIAKPFCSRKTKAAGNKWVEQRRQILLRMETLIDTELDILAEMERLELEQRATTLSSSISELKASEGSLWVLKNRLNNTVEEMQRCNLEQKSLECKLRDMGPWALSGMVSMCRQSNKGWDRSAGLCRASCGCCKRKCGCCWKPRQIGGRTPQFWNIFSYDFAWHCDDTCECCRRSKSMKKMV